MFDDDDSIFGVLAVLMVATIVLLVAVSCEAIYVMGLREFIVVHGRDSALIWFVVILGIKFLWDALTKPEIWPELTCEEPTEEDVPNEIPVENTTMESTYHKDTPVRPDEDAPIKPDTEKGETVDSFLKELQEINKDFLDVDILHNALTMESILQQIKYQINLHPELADNTTKFLNKYMPTTLQLLSSYVEMNQQMHVTEFTVEAKESIKESVEMMISALVQQLDSIQNMNALDVTTSSEAMQNMLALNGYGSNPLERVCAQTKM